MWEIFLEGHMLSTVGDALTTTTSSQLDTTLKYVTLVWTPCLMHRCVYLMVHITKLQLQTTFPKPLYIPHFACIHGTLAAENLDVCTACDPWDSNIQLTMVNDRREQIYPKCQSNRKLTMILISQSWGCPPGPGMPFLDSDTCAEGGGLFIFVRVFFPIWCHPWMDG
jgi:hypothetical protein